MKTLKQQNNKSAKQTTHIKTTNNNNFRILKRVGNHRQGPPAMETNNTWGIHNFETCWKSSAMSSGDVTN